MNLRARQSLKHALEASFELEAARLNAATEAAAKIAAEIDEDEEIAREAARGCCIEMLNDIPFSADDLRFLATLIGMAWSIRPGALFLQLHEPPAGASPAPAQPESTNSLPEAGAPTKEPHMTPQASTAFDQYCAEFFLRQQRLIAVTQAAARIAGIHPKTPPAEGESAPAPAPHKPAP